MLCRRHLREKTHGAPGGTLEGNSDLLWYAIGVGQMMQRAITDPKSWWYFGAIYGAGPEWGSITAPPQVPPLPSPELQGWKVNASTRRGIFRRGTAAI